MYCSRKLQIYKIDNGTYTQKREKVNVCKTVEAKLEQCVSIGVGVARSRERPVKANPEVTDSPLITVKNSNQTCYLLSP